MNPWIVNPVNAGMMIQIHLVQSNDHMKAKMKHLALLLSALFLAACSAGEKPRAAEFIAPTESSIDFGNLRVHYNALPTLSLSEAVASEHGVTRDAESAMLVVALREKVGNEEIPASGKVTAQAYDLQGNRQSVAFHAVQTGDYSDQIGTFAIHAHDSYRIEVQVEAKGRTETFKLQRSF